MQIDIERFHNELAMRLGYERIVNDNRILISVEESEDPVVTLKLQGNDEIRFKASDDAYNGTFEAMPEVEAIMEASHYAFLKANRPF